MKRQLAFFLTVVMLLTALVPMTAFATEPTSGFRITQSNGTTNDYTTITEAVAALADGDTLTMYEDASTTTILDIAADDVVIDGNSKKITCTGTTANQSVFHFTGSNETTDPQDVLVKNLVIDWNTSNKSGTYTFRLEKNVNVKFENGTINAISGERAIYLGATATNSTFTLKDSTINSTYGNIGFTVDCSTAKGIIINSTVTSNERAVAVYQGVLQIDSGTFSGGSNTTVDVAGGTATINGGTFNGGSSIYALKARSTTDSTTINGGTFNGKSHIAIINESTGKLTIKGGNFSNTKIDDTPTIKITNGSIDILGGCFIGANRLLDMTNSTKGVISNGVFKTTFSYAFALENTSDLTVNGGYYTSAGNRPVVRLFNSGKITVNDGYFYNSGTEALWGAIGTNSGDAGERIVINGGTFVSSNNAEVIYAASNSGTMAVNGGIFYNGSASATENVVLNGTHNAIDTTKVTILTELPEMLDGAAVRIVRLATANPSATDIAENSGLRFTTTISAAMQTSLEGKANVKYGTLICPTDYLVDNGLEMPTHAGLDALGLSYVDIEATEIGTTEEANGDLTLRAALTAIKAENYDRAFSAVAYASYTIGDVTVYIYSVYDAATNSRSIKSVATSALADTTVTFNEQQEAILNAYAGN